MGLRWSRIGAILVPLFVTAIAAAAVLAHSLQNGPGMKANDSCPSSNARASVAGTIGRVLVTDADNHQEVAVPKGTIVEVNLSARGWTLPRSSDQHSLPRLSAMSSCDGSVSAMFSALGSGTITAVGGGSTTHGGPTIRFEIDIEAL